LDVAALAQAATNVRRAAVLRHNPLIAATVQIQNLHFLVANELQTIATTYIANYLYRTWGKCLFNSQKDESRM
jgi:hypothetical protein